MTSDAIGGSDGMLGRFRLPKLAKPRSPTAAFCKRRRNRFTFVVALLSLLCCSAAQGYAAENLECPEIGPGRVPDLLGDATGDGLFVSVLEQQIAANRLAPGTLLIASVPLPPDVFRELRSQAAASGQTTTQLMAAILTRAAGK